MLRNESDRARRYRQWAAGVFAALAMGGFSATAARGDQPAAVEAGKPTDLSKVPEVANKPFAPGEELKYVIKYEFVVAGHSSLEVADGGLVGGRPALILTSKAESNKVTDIFFKVRDFNESRVDRATLASLGFHQNLHEGGYRVIRNTIVYYDQGIYTYKQEKKGTVRTSTGPVDGAVADILSSFFVTRTLPLELGKEYRIRVLSDEKVYFLRVNVGPKIEEVRVPAGKYSCLRVQPQIVGDAIFKAQEGRMTIWLTNDERRVPVLIRSKVAIGAFDAELEEAELPKL